MANDRTLGQWIDEGLANGDSHDDIDSDFKLEYGVPASAFHRDTKISDLEANKKKILAEMPSLIRPKTEEELEAEDAKDEAKQGAIPEPVEIEGSGNAVSALQALQRSKPKRHAELVYHPLDKLYGIAKGAYRSVVPSDAETTANSKQRMLETGSQIPGETTAEGDLLSEPANFPQANKKTGTVGYPEGYTSRKLQPPRQHDKEGIFESIGKNISDAVSMIADEPASAAMGLLKGSPPAVGLGAPLWSPPEGSPKTERARTAGRNDRIERNESHHPLINALSDTADVVTILPKLLADTLLGDYIPEGLSNEEQSNVVQHRGRQFGEEFTSGVVGGTSSIGEGFAHHPVNSLTSRPATVVATIGAPLHALGKLGKAGAISVGIDPGAVVGKTSDVVGKTTSVPGISHLLNGFQDFTNKLDTRLTKLGLPEDSILTVKRMLAEGFRQTDPRASALAESIGLDSDAAVNEVEAAVKQMIAHGKLEGTIDQTGAPIVEPRPTIHKVFENGVKLKPRPSALDASDPNTAYRITGKDQLTDMESTGLVRAKDGKMNGGKTGETQWTRGGPGINYSAESNPGRFVITTKSSGLHERVGGLPVSEVTSIFESDGTKWTEVDKPTTVPSPTKPPFKQPPAELVEISSSYTDEPHTTVESSAKSGQARKTSVDSFLQSNKRANTVVSRIAELIDNNPETLEATKARVADRLLSTLDNEGVARLNDPEFRKEVGKRLVTKLAKLGIVDEKVLKKQIGEVLARAAKEGIDTKLQIGAEVVDVNAIIRDVLDIFMTDKQRATIGQNAMEVVGTQLAHEAGTNLLKHGITTEHTRFSDLHKGGDPEALAANEEFAKVGKEFQDKMQAQAENQHGPGAKYVGGSPLDQNIWNIAMGIMRGDLSPRSLPSTINPIHLAQGLRWIADKFADTQGKKSLLLNAAREAETFVPMDKILGVEGSMEPLFHQSLKWLMKSKQGVLENAMAAFDSMYKRNMTSRNPASAINNVGSNTGLVMVSRGVDPATLVESTIRAKSKLGKWQRGEKLPVEEQQFFDALSRGSTLESDMVKADYSTTKSKLDIGNLPGFKQLNEHMFEPFYRAGDNLLKLEETWDNYFGKANRYIKMMKDGRSMEVDLSNHRSYVIERAGDKFKVSTPQDVTNGKPPIEMAANDPRLIRILVEACAKPAQDKFFNYANGGLLGKMMKTLPLIGTKSGFYSYISMALDIPFVKKGLLYRSLVDIGFNPKTNDPGILVLQAADNIALGARKAMLVNGLTQELKDKSNQELAKIFRFMANEDKSQIAMALSNPGYVASANFGGMNYAQISTSLFRMLADVYAASTRPTQEELYPVKPGTAKGVDINLTSLPHEARQRILRARELVAKHDNGELWTAPDALVMVGAAGDAIRNMVDWISESKEAGKVLHIDDVWGKFGSLFVTPTGQKLADMAASLPTNGRPIHTRLVARELGMEPDTLDKVVNGPREFFSSRAKAIQADEQLTIPMMQWVFKKFTGLGWQAKNFKEASDPSKPGSYFNKLGAEWKASLSVPARLREAKKWKAVAKYDAKNAHTADEILRAMQLADDAHVMARSVARDVKIIQKELKGSYKRYKVMANKLLDTELPNWPEEVDDDIGEAARIMEADPSTVDKEVDSLIDDVSHE